MIRDIIQLLRPHQWVKNGIVLAGLIFSGSAIHMGKDLNALIATAIFCLLSSTIYIINDIADAEADRKHPAKSNRPIASGRITVMPAIIIAIILGAGSLTWAYFTHWGFFITAISYVILNILYSFVLKHVVLIDVMSIAAGFVLRALGGALVIDVDFSGWLLITSFLLAMFLALGKRRHEMVVLENGGKEHRKILEKYSTYFLDQLISVVTPAVLVCYLIYVISPDVKERLGTDYLYITVPFVIYGIFRYYYLIHQKNKGGSPTRILLTDLPIMITVFLWLSSSILLLYCF
ncbi:MAG: decaprenyl-phosphate phosphoribosyltransferase [candidate division Zixibacteria bacterium]|nr:decaprenyl-phosphate phosphoribosyltransferase [candidate division Zixibacteria bacterium]